MTTQNTTDPTMNELIELVRSARDKANAPSKNVSMMVLAGIWYASGVFIAIMVFACAYFFVSFESYRQLQQVQTQKQVAHIVAAIKAIEAEGDTVASKIRTAGVVPPGVVMKYAQWH